MGYFSFERMITTSFVKVVYFLGFIALTAASVAFTVWAGMQLNDATISQSLGWRYVAIGVATLIVGNIVWRVFCELWVVLFGIHAELVSVRHALNLSGFHREVNEPSEREVIEEHREVVRPREVVVHDRPAPRQTGVLGLS